jgi:hypothetical protein
MARQLLYNFLLGSDQMLNVLLLGDPDESLSGRLGRAMASGRAKWWVPSCARTVDRLARWVSGEIDHCANAVEPEEAAMNKELWSWIHPAPAQIYFEGSDR